MLSIREYCGGYEAYRRFIRATNKLANMNDPDKACGDCPYTRDCKEYQLYRECEVKEEE